MFAKYNGLFDNSLKKGSILHLGFYSEQLILDFFKLKMCVVGIASMVEKIQ